jgi:hypothetical protein
MSVFLARRAPACRWDLIFSENRCDLTGKVERGRDDENSAGLPLSELASAAVIARSAAAQSFIRK